MKARVTARPEKGKANAALIALIAKTLAGPESVVAIAKGETARNKMMEIAGDGATLKARLEALGDAS